MQQRESEIIEAGAQLIYVLQDPSNINGTADGAAANDFWTDSVPSAVGLRVGDDVTAPIESVFSDSDYNTFRLSRGSVMVVRKSDMLITFGDHRSPVDTLLAEIEASRQ